MYLSYYKNDKINILLKLNRIRDMNHKLNEIKNNNIKIIQEG